MHAFARRLVEGFPSWQVVLVDLRCHGESAGLQGMRGPHTVEAAAADVTRLLQALKVRAGPPLWRSTRARFTRPCSRALPSPPPPPVPPPTHPLPRCSQKCSSGTRSVQSVC